MATIKSYTDLEQSLKLAEILPLESADLYYNLGESKIPEFIIGSHSDYKCYIPCWSLSALLDILPKGTNISTPDPLNKIRYSCWNDYDIIYADNPVDACYEMIIKLHEMNLL